MMERKGHGAAPAGLVALAFGLVIAASSSSQATPPAGPHILFFEPGSPTPGHRAGEVLDFAAAQFRQLELKGLTIRTHTDRGGSDAYNLRLSEKRAEALRALLIRRGIPERAIRMEPMGESQPLVETPDGVSEPQNRRAEISFELS
jgi:outer membrane protein OmpA-like peptidoglycan-associated protein